MKKIILQKNTLILVTILILASVLRLWNLANFPVGLNADEASIGYNAYSLLTTGKDEYGTSFPLIFKSFGDYKPGLYFYFVMPFVALLGLTELAVRLPSAILGVATVLLIYLLAKKIYQNSTVALFSAFLLAISPWHIHFSRGGWESNVATFFIALGVWYFLKSLENLKFISLSGLSFLISMYLYQSPRVVLPILFILLLVFYRNYFLPQWKKTVIYLVPVAILTIPLIFQFLGGGGEARFSGLSFLGDPGPASRINELRGEYGNLNSKFAMLLHNKITAYAPNFLGHYLDHFSSDFLFISGDPLIRNKVPETGEFYLIESLFLIIGIIFLIKSKNPHQKLLIIWILVAPLASSLTYQTPSALRSLNMVLPLTLIAGYGLAVLIKWKSYLLRSLTIFLISLVLLFEFWHYLDSFYIHYPKRYPLAWEYGFSQMVNRLVVYQNQYQKVIITDKYDQPYILVLFYEKYNPIKYQPQAILSPRDKFNFGTIRSFDKYEFRAINPEEVGKTPGVLYIGTPSEIPHNANIIDKINFPNGEGAFIFAKT